MDLENHSEVSEPYNDNNALKPCDTIMAKTMEVRGLKVDQVLPDPEWHPDTKFVHGMMRAE